MLEFQEQSDLNLPVVSALHRASLVQGQACKALLSRFEQEEMQHNIEIANAGSVALLQGNGYVQIPFCASRVLVNGAIAGT